MKNTEELNEKIIIWASLGALALGAGLLTLMAGSVTDAARQAQQYELGCLTEPIEKPLEECKK